MAARLLKVLRHRWANQLETSKVSVQISVDVECRANFLFNFTHRARRQVTSITLAQFRKTRFFPTLRCTISRLSLTVQWAHSHRIHSCPGFCSKPEYLMHLLHINAPGETNPVHLQWSTKRQMRRKLENSRWTGPHWLPTQLAAPACLVSGQPQESDPLQKVTPCRNSLGLQCFSTGPTGKSGLSAQFQRSYPGVRIANNKVNPSSKAKCATVKFA